MNTTVTLDKAGRLILPKPIREALRIGPGDSLEIESTEDRIVLSPVRVRPGLQKEHGVWVFHSGKPVNVSIPDLIDNERERRTRDLTTKRS
ncbi:MAG TPA: AbrB/MazE/SpoVT family DNA-binding domain-containing protein [Bryobacteraceae bacterium]